MCEAVNSRVREHKSEYLTREAIQELARVGRASKKPSDAERLESVEIRRRRVRPGIRRRKKEERMLVTKDFARQLTAAREHAGLTIAGVAYIVSALIEDVEAWERGETIPPPAMYIRLCMAFPELRDDTLKNEE